MLARSSIAHAQQGLSTLADADLLSRLHQLISRDRALTAQLVVHIAEVDARALCRSEAYASTFDYAVKARHMSESEAYVRIRIARLSRQFPDILPVLERNEIHLSALKLEDRRAAKPRSGLSGATNMARRPGTAPTCTPLPCDAAKPRPSRRATASHGTLVPRAATSSGTTASLMILDAALKDCGCRTRLPQHEYVFRLAEGLLRACSRPR